MTTTLGADVLLFYQMTAREELGRLFKFTVDLLSEDPEIALADVLGQKMTVTGDTSESTPRYFDGFVSQFTQVGQQGKYSKYRATLVPWLWFLTRKADCRIFQAMTIPDIIKQVFTDHGFSANVSDKLAGTYREWEYCVQYRETDFNFVSRLMEQEGIYYYFLHSDGDHTLELSDDYSSHGSVTNYDTIPFFPPGNRQRRDVDHISQWAISQQVRTGTYVLDTFDFTAPTADLQVNAANSSHSHPYNDYEMYDYPGEYVAAADGDAYVTARIQAQQAEYERVRGTGDARGLVSGALFTLDQYPRADQNREYLIISTVNEMVNNEYETDGSADSKTAWECSFEAMPSDVPYRSPRRTRKPTIRGPQTAIIVGPSGEEIWTDEYGRVKVQFHWDRLGVSDENSSCWVRVAQIWAGNTWGAIHIPRIGQEVIVEFLEGDPDHPIITGRVYNADNMPPYTLPDDQTQSGIKSRSTKEGTEDNFNELRFEDKAESELIYFHAEKDFERIVENNDTLKVGFEKKDAGDQVIDIHNDQTVTIGNSNSKAGSQTITVWKDHTQTIKTGNQAITISKGNHSIKISAGQSEYEAAKSILLKVGGSSIKIEPACITMKSTAIKIEGSASLDMKAAMTTCKGTGQLTLKGGMTMIN